MSERAVILAGGKGTRLRPYTVVLPKPLMPIGEFPILEVIIRQLSKSRFRRITLAVNHQAELIKTFFGDGSKWGVQIDYSLEDAPLSTMGPLKLIRDLPDDFLVMNGDILTDLDYRIFAQHHLDGGHIFSICSAMREHVLDYGVIDTDSSGTMIGFREKPCLQYEVSMGIYMLNRKVLDFIPSRQSYGFDNLMADLLTANRPASVIRHEGYWLDIGRPDDYGRAVDEFEGMKSRLLRD